MSDNKPTSVNLSNAAVEYLDWVRDEYKKKHKLRPSRSQLIELIVTHQISLDEYPIPETIRKEIFGE